MTFEFATARRIVFGPGKLEELSGIAASMGTRAALLTGSSADRIGPVFEILKKCGANPAAFSISEEPTTDRIAAIALFEAHGFECWGEKPRYARLKGRYIGGRYYTKQLG